ncbi:cupin domain-containing protein [Amycolatopsis anabasis]|uniref:cupin domain-containing protein n=1 Tax=Amycolatopsis anabasis TaxID=1840409 RepID=UPI00131E0FC3|nr:cupin domain-containing protein [Amycolatopsis anabasis]
MSLDATTPPTPHPRSSGAEPFHTNVSALPPVRGVQQQVLIPAVHSGVAPVRGLSAGVVRMPGGHSTQAHEHAESEIVVYVHQGIAASLCGEEMEPVLHWPGSVIWIPPGVPHAALNLEPEEEVAAFEARTDQTFGDDTVLRPDLDDLVAERVRQLRRDYALGQLSIDLAHSLTPETGVDLWE